jgi:hypothetical protein
MQRESSLKITDLFGGDGPSWPVSFAKQANGLAPAGRLFGRIAARERLRTGSRDTSQLRIKGQMPGVL